MGNKPSAPRAGSSAFEPFTQSEPFPQSPRSYKQTENMSSIAEKDPGKPPFPPFTFETATIKVKAAQDMWNTKDPHKVKHGYTSDSIWRNRDTFLKGTDQIVEFLTKKWARENGYRLRKELFAFRDNKVCESILLDCLCGY